MRWVTTLALIALEKLKQHRDLAESDREALSRFGDDLQAVAKRNDRLEGEVFFVRQLSGDRPSGSLRRLLAMNSPKLSTLSASSLQDASDYICRLAKGNFTPPSNEADEQHLDETLSTCQAVLGAI